MTTYTYGLPSTSEKRAVVTGIAFTAPSGVADPADIGFTYDPAGNRTYMSDGTGTLTYTYDELSRLKTETKDFTDSLSGAPSGGVYTLTYTYHLRGGLKSMAGPFTQEVKYTSDAVGRITAVGNGSDSSAYASGISYRAFGTIKSMSLSATDPVDVAMTYDNALRPATYEADSDANTSDIHNASYSFRNDGTLDMLDNAMDARFDQVSKYDFAGRLKVNDVGNDTAGSGHHPLVQTLSYDAFNNLTTRSVQTYALSSVSFAASYTNNRKTSGTTNNSYDAAGNVISSTRSDPLDLSYWAFDAAGRQWRWEELGPEGPNTKKAGETTFDADGRQAKQTTMTKYRDLGVWGDWIPYNRYYIYSSVTGQKITSLLSDGAIDQTHIYLGDTNIANLDSAGNVAFKLTDPVSGSTRQVDEDGAIYPGDEVGVRNEMGALGTSTPHVQPSTMPLPNYSLGGHVGSPEGCQLNNGPVHCDQIPNILKSMGVLFLGRHLIVDTYRQKHVFRTPPGTDGPTVPWGEETYLGSYLELVRSEVVELPRALVREQAGSRRDRADLPEWVKAIYRDNKLAKRLTDCINKIFGAKNVTVTRGGRTFEISGAAALQGQKIANAPYVDEATFTGYKLGGGTGKRAYGRVFPENVYDYSTAKQNNFIPGTVYIANDIKDKTVNGQTFTAREIQQKAYIHELGNILAFFLTGDANYFGEAGGVPLAANPNEKDRDTGAALEKCVYDTPQLIP